MTHTFCEQHRDSRARGTPAPAHPPTVRDVDLSLSRPHTVSCCPCVSWQCATTRLSFSNVSNRFSLPAVPCVFLNIVAWFLETFSGFLYFCKSASIIVS